MVLNTEWKPRTSWTIWEENDQYPNVIVEVLSPKTARKDKGKKKLLYQNIFRTPEYFYFSPRTLEFQGFRLKNGEYEKLKRNEQGRLWSQELGLCLGVHEGFLRYFEVTGKLVPRPEESAEASEQRAIQFEQRAESEAEMRQIAEQRAESEKLAREKLAAKLRELNIDPDSI